LQFTAQEETKNRWLLLLIFGIPPCEFNIKEDADGQIRISFAVFDIDNLIVITFSLNSFDVKKLTACAL
jgi:hypothetical protein